MGVKLRVGLLTCGTCGRQRGIRHACVTRATSGRRKTRTRLRLRVAARCSRCGKDRGVLHACKVRSDFRKRRRQQAAAERRARGKTRKPEARKGRQRGESHEPGTCGDRDCPRYGCKSYWQGMDDCPLPHNG